MSDNDIPPGNEMVNNNVNVPVINKIIKNSCVLPNCNYCGKVCYTVENCNTYVPAKKIKKNNGNGNVKVMLSKMKRQVIPKVEVNEVDEVDEKNDEVVFDDELNLLNELGTLGVPEHKNEEKLKNSEKREEIVLEYAK